MSKPKAPLSCVLYFRMTPEDFQQAKRIAALQNIEPYQLAHFLLRQFIYDPVNEAPENVGG
jgi:hypothetical protein